MCGITGCNADIESEVLQNMTDILSHRGPDFSATESIGNIHFGHTRLSILDLNESSNQPLWDIDKTACIVFNGEIYNYKKLKERLIKRGYRFKSKGDAEVLLNMYIEYGSEMLNDIDGIFAFAIWDTKHEELFLARDQFGIKPLYYIENESGFFFSSEIKSILLSKCVKKEININALYKSLIFMWSPGKETIFKGIYKLPPASFLIVKNKRIKSMESYWNWDEYSPKKNKVNDIKKNLLESLGKTVDDQLVSDVPIGTFLSGGLDSSLITALALRKNNNIQSFTIDTNQKNIDDDGFINDLPYAKEASKFFLNKLNIVKAESTIVKNLPNMIYHLEELHSDPAPINVQKICALARKKGIKVLLSGAGGDDIFTGYRRHIAIRSEQFWSFLPLFLRKGLKYLSSLMFRFGSFGRRINKAFYYADLEKDERLFSYFYWADPKKVKLLFNDNIQDSLDNDINKPFINSLRGLKTNCQLEKMLHLERVHFLSDHNLSYTDKMSMSEGVEVRVPFLSLRNSKIASEIDNSIKQKNNTGKWILKKVAEEFLPKKIIYRSKTGFGAPLRTWLKNDLKSYIDEYLSKERIESRGIFKFEKVNQMIQDDRNGIGDFSYIIFGLLYLEIWFETFIDNENPKEVSLKC